MNPFDDISAQNKLAKVDGYIRRIRNPKKRDYAERYRVYLLNGEKGPEPDYTISTMAAQGVRLGLQILMDA